jgi:hypothetical protein
MKKRCLSCGVQFTLSGSGKRQKYCPKCARRGDGRGRGLPASKPLKTNGAEKHFWTPIPHDARSPIHFTTPEGDKGRIWISDRNDRRGEELYWRVNIAEAKRLAERPCGFSEPREATSDVIRIEGNSHVHLTRLEPNPPARDPRCILPDIWPRPWGYKVKLYIEAEKELQELGCGERTVVVEFDGNKVHVHHNGRMATMKRDKFKELIAANKRYRIKARRPHLKLVISNPPKFDERVSDAA